MIVHENPSDDPRSTRLPYLPHPRNKMLTVFVIRKNIDSLDAANHHVMKRPGSIQSGLPWHSEIISQPKLNINRFVTIVINVPLIRSDLVV